MLTNYFKIAWRSLTRRKSQTAINVIGLSVGLAACLLIGLFVWQEWQVDRFHEKGERIYRVGSNLAPSSGEAHRLPTVARAVTETIEEDVPEIERMVPVRTSSASIRVGNEHFFDEVRYAGRHFFEVFSFPLLAGNPQEVLVEPYQAVVTASAAERYFGTADAVGETLFVNDSLQFAVTGIAADPPRSHFTFDVLLSHATLIARGDNREAAWGNWDEYLYVQLREDVDAAAAREKIAGHTMRRVGEQMRANGTSVEHVTEALPALYLHSDRMQGLSQSGSAEQLYVLGAIAFFVLLIAGVNFVNLSTARSVERAREVGVRKVAGANREQLIGQYLCESTALALLSGLVALGLARLALPLFGRLTESALSLEMLLSPVPLLAFAAVVLATGLLAGAYPAFTLSRFRPAETLKGSFATGRRGTRLRQGLVVLQFALSVALIAATLVAFQQLRFMQGQELGFEKEHVLVVNTMKTPFATFVDQHESLKEQLEALPSVQQAAATGAVPGRSGWPTQNVWPEGWPEDEYIHAEVITADHGFAETMGLELAAGRYLSRDFATDADDAALVNETAARQMGWTPEEALGRRIQTSALGEGTIVGVLEDYHHHGLQQEVGPQVLFVYPWGYRHLALRLAPGNVQQAISEVEQIWNARFPGYPFDYSFLDETYDAQYQAEARLAQAFGLFAGLAILVACLGLFGLAAYSAQQRTKEIGVRKALGASVSSIVALLSKDFARPVLFAILLAAPVAYVALDRWLASFAHRTDVGVDVLLLAGLLALTVALATVSLHALRAARLDPAEALRDE